MHQLSIRRQSERVKGDCWMSDQISSPSYSLPPAPQIPRQRLLLDRYRPDQQHQACRAGSEEGKDYKMVAIRVTDDMTWPLITCVSTREQPEL